MTTWNSGDKHANVTLSGGDLTASVATGPGQHYATHYRVALGYDERDVPWYWRAYIGTPSIVPPEPGVAAEYQVDLPAGVVVTDQNPTTLTFVGGV